MVGEDKSDGLQRICIYTVTCEKALDCIDTRLGRKMIWTREGSHSKFCMHPV